MKTKLAAFTSNSVALTAAVGLLAFGGILLSSAFLASAQEAPEVSATIHNSNGDTITSAPLGALVHTHALVEAGGSATTTPTGTVDFNRYANDSCDGTPNVEENVELDNDGEAQSQNATLGEGGLSYRVHYDGDDDHAPGDSDCESVSADPADTSIDLSLSTTTIVVGGEARASAELAGESDAADGTVTYTVYSNSSCSANARDAGAKEVNDGEVDDSNSLTFNDTGDFYWRAVYSGDEDNEAATSSCSDNRLRVLATSTSDDNDNDDNDDDNDGNHGKPFFLKKFLPPGIFEKIFDDEGFPNGHFFNKVFNKSFKNWHDEDGGDTNDEDDEDDDNDRHNTGRSNRSR